MSEQSQSRPELVIDAALARALVAAQFPHWAHLPVTPVAFGGWHNRTFHLGDSMIARLPGKPYYRHEVDKEQLWLPRLAPQLPLPIPTPLALGEPGEGYPWRWSIYGWIEGETAGRAQITDRVMFARDLARFLQALHAADAAGGPAPGRHNFFRGGPLATYDRETRDAIAVLADRIDGPLALGLWEAALAAAWDGRPVWLHGDVSPGNMLARDGVLSAVIDFGSCAVGDPACDLAIAWTFFEGESRAAFRDALPLDPGTWARGLGWALWKALIVTAKAPGTNQGEAAISLRVLQDLIGGVAGVD